MATVSGQNTQNKIKVSNNQARYYSEVAGSYAQQAGTSATLCSELYSSVQSSATSAITNIGLATNAGLGSITTATTEGTTSIDTATINGVGSVNDKKTESLSIISVTTEATKTEITNLGNGFLGSINTAGTSTTDAIGSALSSATSAIETTKSLAVETTEAIGVSVVSATTAATEGLTVEKVSIINATTEACKTEITNLSDGYVTTITSLGTSATQAIETTKADALTTINGAKTNAINTISANVATTSANVNKSAIWAEGSDEQVQALGGSHSAKEWCRYNSTVNQNDVRALQGACYLGAIYTKNDSDSINSRLDEIIAMKHSSFVGVQDSNGTDPKKFTKVGSPTVTSDGIASGFSGVTLTLNYNRLNLYNAKTWEAEFGVFINDNSGTTYSNECGINFVDSTFPLMGGIYLSGDGKIRFFRNNIWGISSPVFNIGDFIKVKLKYDNATGTYSMYISTNGGAYTFINSYTPTDEDKRLSMETSGNIQLMSKNTGGSDVSATGSFDLKQFSITVDGVEVFSGNKTGIDTIKPVDFTAITSSVSSPFVNPSLPFSDNGLTITEDGVASGFVSGNTVYSNVSVGASDNFTLVLPVKVTDSVSTLRGIANLYNTSENDQVVRVRTESSRLRVNGFGGAIGNFDSRSDTISANMQYYIKVDRNGNTVTINYYDESFNKITDTTLNETFDITGYTINSIDKLRIGMVSGTAGKDGLVVDLNGVKLYKNGNLIYQPMLRIPYTQSSTKYGSKIVNAIYRNRVTDAWEQGFKNRYYTLDEANGNFTLPMGELYGDVENNSNYPDYVSSVTTNDINGSANAYTISNNSLAIIKPATPASTYTVTVNGTGIECYGYMPLWFKTGDKVYTSVSAVMQVFKV